MIRNPYGDGLRVRSRRKTEDGCGEGSKNVCDGGRVIGVARDSQRHCMLQHRALEWVPTVNRSKSDDYV